MLRIAHAALAAALALTATACDREALTRDEAREALEQTQLSTEAHALTTDMVVLTTDFTLDGAVETAAENLRGFVRSQIPCADVQRARSVVTIDFGVAGTCDWNGRTWTGSTTVEVHRVDGTAHLSHTWAALSDGFLTIDGTADVTWNPSAHTRRVVHALTWSDGARTGEATGDRTQRPLDGGGLQIDGDRTWTGTQGNTWTLGIDGVEIRGIDPLPQAGAYHLTTPAGKGLTLRFARVNTVTIRVSIGNGDREFEFDVLSLR